MILAGHEAGGVASEDSSFIFLQAMAGRVEVPIWVRGGIGPHSAAGCVAAGAHGVVLDGALLLARESSLPDPARERIARCDGGDTQVFGPADGPRRRVHVAPGSPALAGLRSGEAWDEVAARWIGWGPDQAWPIGRMRASPLRWPVATSRRAGSSRRSRRASTGAWPRPGFRSRWRPTPRLPGRTAPGSRSSRGR